MSDICIFCKNNEISKQPYGHTTPSINTIKCSNCGRFQVSDITQSMLEPDINQIPQNDLLKIGVFLRTQTLLNPDSSYKLDFKDYSSDKTIVFKKFNTDEAITMEQVIKDFPRNISARLDAALINLSKMSKFTGDPITINTKTDYPLFYPDSREPEAFNFMFELLVSVDYITEKNKRESELDIVITHAGWNRIIELESINKYSKQAFVAMWFAPEMDNARESIKSAIGDKEAGEYKAIIVDEKEHNNGITDEIIAEIRRSKFVVADLTGDRGGVYYEAGFAKGLNIPVILTCRKDWFQKSFVINIKHSDTEIKDYDSRTIHFDVTHLNIIVWENEEDLRIKLLNRIRATII